MLAMNMKCTLHVNFNAILFIFECEEVKGFVTNYMPLQIFNVEGNTSDRTIFTSNPAILLQLTLRDLPFIK